MLALSGSSKALSNLVQEDLKPKFIELSTNLGNVKSELLTLMNLASSDKVPVVLLENYRDDVKAKVKYFEDDNKVLNESLQQKGLKIQALNAEVSDFGGKVETAKIEIVELKSQIVNIGEKEAKITRLQGQIDEMQRVAKETTLENFVLKANEQITEARKSLIQKGNKYALGRVSLDLKMYPVPSGVGMAFPSLDELKALGDSKLSTISVDFEAQESTADKVTTVTAPTVLGYTEVVARRKIIESGLLVEISYQAVTDVSGRTIEADRVVNQIPKAGDEVPLGSYVTIFIGRKS